MCNPTAFMAMYGMSAASSTVGAYYGAQSQKAGLALQADLDEYGRQNALLQGQREEQRSRLNTANVKSAQRAAMAANGVALDEGSALAVQTGTDLIGESDAEQIRANALKQAFGYRVDQIMKRAQSDAISPGMAAMTSLLGSGTRVAEGWYSLQKMGALNNGT